MTNNTPQLEKLIEGHDKLWQECSVQGMITTSRNTIADYWLSKISLIYKEVEELEVVNRNWKLALTHLPKEYRDSVLKTHETLLTRIKKLQE